MWRWRGTCAGHFRDLKRQQRLQGFTRVYHRQEADHERQKAKEEHRESSKWSLASDQAKSSTLEGHLWGRIRSVESLKSSVLLYLIRVPRITSAR